LSFTGLFPRLGGVVHTHSEFATAWAQAGSRHSRLWHHACRTTFLVLYRLTQELSDEEIQGDYVLNTGKAIVRRFSGA